MEKITIMGFGNPVREDDGVGVYVVQQLKQRIGEREGLSIYDMGTGAFELLFKLKDQDKIILIDAVVNTADPTGTLYKVPAEELMGKVEDDPLVFLHSLKWDQALSYVKKIFGDDYLPKTEVFLIAIKNTRFDTQMSEEARKGADKLVSKIIEELNL